MTVHLYADGKKIESVKLSKANHWQYTFKDLDQYKDGKEITYTVKEEAISGYDITITGDVKNGFVITNTKETPRPPVKPNQPGTPKTGDMAKIGLYLAMSLLALVGLFTLILKRSRR